jgi:hypothetical protein
MKCTLALALFLVCAGALGQQYRYNVQRELQCDAKPYCAQPGRACKGVEKTYIGSAAGSAKDKIVRACVEANRPDRCNCIQQCRQVARCNKI